MWRLFVVALLLVLATGCTSVRYITQAAAGQERLNQGGISIQEVLEGRRLDARTRTLLSHVEPIKAFAVENGLVHTQSYKRYLWLPRPAVIWVVSACDPVRFKPQAWKFPVVGSITYTGWFDLDEATDHARELAKDGWDVDVRESPAYSTLGFFDDPLVSTMIIPGEEALGELADTLLHETLHATYYVPGQSTLNESVAAFVGHTLSIRYLDKAVGPTSLEKTRFVTLRARSEARAKQYRVAYAELEKIYASPLTKAEKLVEKKKVTDRLHEELHISRPVTNATLIQYKTYGSGREELEALFEMCGGDMKRLLKRLDAIRGPASKAPNHSDPGDLVRPLLAGGC